METYHHFTSTNTAYYTHSFHKLIELENEKKQTEKRKTEAIELLQKQKKSQKGRVALRNARLAKASKKKYQERHHIPE